MSAGRHISYRIIPRDPAAHLFEVSLRLSHPDPAGQRLSLPAWAPGSYMIREFARNIMRLSADCGGEALAVQKIDKHTWACAPCRGPLTVTYDVYAYDLSVRAAHLDMTHGYFNGSSVFLMAHGAEGRPCRVEMLPPEGERYRAWRMATSMPPDGAAPFGFGTYHAGDYEDLIDHPVEMGELAMASFEACGVPHDIVITGRQRVDMARLCTDLGAVCAYQIRLFGEPAPFDRYVFLIRALGEGYGGLEHRASASLMCSRDDLPAPGEAGTETGAGEAYRGFLGLASHEYFHAWNVKRIRPQAFVPYDLGHEVYTRTLWAFEGITSYYDNLALLRSGRIAAQAYLELLAQTLTRIVRTPGRLCQTLEESSFDAWIKFYRPNENTPNAVVSYYQKGSIVALALDLILRLGTGRAGTERLGNGGRRSLDDVMRLLWQRYGRTGIGVPEDGIERAAREVAGEIGEILGLDLGGFFEQALRSTQDLPLQDLLAQFGVEMTWRPAESDSDKGGKPAKDGARRGSRSVLGVRLDDQSVEAKLTHVLTGGAALQAGLAAGDVVIAVDGLRATRANLEKRVGALPPGTTVRVHAFRRDELMELDVTLQAAPADTCVLTLAEQPDEAVLARRAAWLGN